jgi:hypothetical protein
VLKFNLRSIFNKIPIIALTFCLIFFFPTIFFTKGFYGFDQITYTWPFLQYLKDNILNLPALLFTTKIFYGAEFAGNLQLGIFYPLKLILLFLPVEIISTLLVMLHFYLFLVGLIYFFHFGLRLKLVSSLFGALSICLSGYFLMNFTRIEQFMVLSWMPIILYQIVMIRSSFKVIRLFYINLFIALAFLAGHPQSFLILLLFILPLLSSKSNFLKIISTGAKRPFVFLPFLLLIPQFLLSIFLFNDNAAISRSSDLINSYSIDSQFMFKTVLGNYFINLITTSSNETLLNVSFVSVFLIIFYILNMIITNKISSSRMLFLDLYFLFWLAFSGLLATGHKFYFVNLLYTHVPLFDEMRVPGRWLFIFLFALGYFSAKGFDLIRNGNCDRLLLKSCYLFILFVIISGMLTSTARAIDFFFPLFFVLVLLIMIFNFNYGHVKILLFSLLVVSLLPNLTFYKNQLLDRESPRSHMPNEYLDQSESTFFSIADENYSNVSYLLSSLRANSNLYTSFYSPDGYDGGLLLTRDWQEFLQKFLGNDPNLDLTLKSQVSLDSLSSKLISIGVFNVIVNSSAASYFPEDKWRIVLVDKKNDIQLLAAKNIEIISNTKSFSIYFDTEMNNYFLLIKSFTQMSGTSVCSDRIVFPFAKLGVTKLLLTLKYSKAYWVTDKNLTTFSDTYGILRIEPTLSNENPPFNICYDLNR